MSDVPPEIQGWLNARIDDTGMDETLPALADAVRNGNGTFRGAPALARLLAAGWTPERLNAALVRGIEHTPLWGGHGILAYVDALTGIADLANLSPDEFDAWSASFGHNLATISANTLAIDVWRACVPGPLAAYCAAAGLAPTEAAAMYATGVLDASVLQSLVALQGADGTSA